MEVKELLDVFKEIEKQIFLRKNVVNSDIEKVKVNESR